GGALPLREMHSATLSAIGAANAAAIESALSQADSPAVAFLNLYRLSDAARLRLTHAHGAYLDAFFEEIAAVVQRAVIDPNFCNTRDGAPLTSALAAEFTARGELLAAAADGHATAISMLEL
ncbi:MAG: hypothetical protein IT285_08005, partial [Bdellovibrionales bacterium]|nr:hypothetical protein [Bdellovibrionales bacterium]